MKDWPRNPTQELFIEQLQKVLEENGKLSRKEVGDKFDDENLCVAGATAKSWLSTHRGYLEKQDFVAQEEPDGSPGETTVYWRLKK